VTGFCDNCGASGNRLLQLSDKQVCGICGEVQGPGLIPQPFDLIQGHIHRIRELMEDVDVRSATENERTLNLAISHLTSAVEALAAHVASQQSDRK
jgi:hypothetical protein